MGGFCEAAAMASGPDAPSAVAAVVIVGYV